MVEKMTSLSLQEWPRFFIERALGQMKKFYGSLTPDDLLGGDPMESYRRRRIAAVIERIIQSVANEDSEPPFTHLPGTPYSYPAFELCGVDENGETILAVDIHTVWREHMKPMKRGVRTHEQGE